MNRCEFCLDSWVDKPLGEGGAHDFRLSGNAIYYYDPIFGWEGITIKFCPMCGRALDDEPVKHGRWKDTTEFYPWEDDDGMRRYRCSECGRKILASKECDPAVVIPYCRCGAKMDKEESNG